MTRFAAFPALILLFAGAFSGCLSQAGSPASASPTASATQDVGDSASTGGSIQGSVVDDEQTPVAGAMVALIRLDVEATTGDDGSFQFNNVPEGSHDLIAQRLGYESHGQKVQVVTGETTKVQLILVPVEIKESYLLVYPHTALHHVGGFTYISWAVNMTNQPLSCSGCVWIAGGGGVPTQYLLEISRTHTVPSVAKPAGEHYWIFRESQGGGKIDECLLATTYQADGGARCFLPIRLPFNETVVAKTKRFWHQIMCDFHWVCVEERREIYVTLFYNDPGGEVPKDYSAKPK